LSGLVSRLVEAGGGEIETETTVAEGMTLLGHLRKLVASERIQERGVGDQGTTAYIFISGEVKITTTPGDRTHCGVASLGKTLTARAESRSGRPYLPLVHTVSRTDTLAVRSYVLD